MRSKTNLRKGSKGPFKEIGRFGVGRYVGRPRSWNVLKSCICCDPFRVMAWTSGERTLCLSSLPADGLAVTGDAPSVKVQVAMPHIEHFSWLNAGAGKAKEASGGCSPGGENVCVGRCGTVRGCVAAEESSEEPASSQFLAIAGLTSLEIWRVSFEKVADGQHSIGASERVFEMKEGLAGDIGRICGVNWGRRHGDPVLALFVSGEGSCACLTFSDPGSFSKLNVQLVNGPVKMSRTHHCWNQTNERSYVAMTASGEVRVQEMNLAGGHGGAARSGGSPANTCLCADLDENESNILHNLSDIQSLNVQGEGYDGPLLFFGHGDSFLSLASTDQDMQGLVDSNNKRRTSLNQIYRDIEQIAKKKDAAKKQAEAGGAAGEGAKAEPIVLGGGSSGVIDLTANLRSAPKTKKMGTLDSLMNLGHMNRGPSSFAIVSSSSAAGHPASPGGNASAKFQPSLLFFKYDRSVGESAKRKIQVVGQMSTTRPTDLVASVSLPRDENLVAVANNASQSIQILRVSYDKGDKRMVYKTVQEIVLDEQGKRLAGMTFVRDPARSGASSRPSLNILLAGRKAQATFFSAEKSTFQYTMLSFKMEPARVEQPASPSSARPSLPSNTARRSVDNPPKARPAPGLSGNAGALMAALLNMQAHLDARMDRIDGMLLQHSARLSRIENSLKGSPGRY
eukprot:g2246.t1